MLTNVATAALQNRSGYAIAAIDSYSCVVSELKHMAGRATAR